MTPTSSSSPSLLLLLLHVLLAPFPAQAQPQPPPCPSFRAGPVHFVLDAQDAVAEGAALLATALGSAPDACERACCRDARCSVALLDERNQSCVLFHCQHRNRFVCRFVRQSGFQSFIREDVFLRYLQGPEGTDDKAPPIAIAGRDVIVQPGKTVTLNGIESLALGDAHIARYQWTLLSGDSTVKMEMTALPDQVKLTNLQSGSYVFQLTVTDSNDQSDAAKVSVLVLDPEKTNLYCLAPPKLGPCRASFPRWRYNAAAGDCESFLFGGCNANNNNFLSKNECLSACSGVSVASERSITLPSAEECGIDCGVSHMTCDSGCCLDRSLECDGVKHCSDGSDEDHCSKLNHTFSRLLDIDVNQKRARCAEPPVTGPCRASLSRWFYDPRDQHCHSFTYGGCLGSGNNFQREDECTDSCDGVTEKDVYFRGMFDRFEKREDGDSGNIALAVLLSVAILALLAILTYCFLKARKQRSHRPVATGPAHPLPEQDTLVYNSTTKPL